MKMHMACGCCSTPNDNGTIKRVYSLDAIADMHGVSDADFNIVTTANYGLEYYIYWLNTSGTESVVMQPVKFNILNAYTPIPVIDKTSYQSDWIMGRADVPVGAHIVDSQPVDLYSPALNAGSGIFGNLPGEPTTIPEDAGNLKNSGGGGAAQAWAFRKGTRIRYFSILEDGVDISGLLDLDDLNPEFQGIYTRWRLWTTSGSVLPLQDPAFPFDFHWKQGRTYEFLVWWELGVDGAEDGIGGKAAIILRKGQAHFYTATEQFAGGALYGNDTAVTIRGLSNNPPFDPSLHCYEITEWEHQDVEGGDAWTPPLPFKMEDTVGPTFCSSPYPDDADAIPVAAGLQLQAPTLSWQYENASMALGHFGVRNGSLSYRPSNPELYSTTTQMSDGQIRHHGKQGLFNINGPTDFYPTDTFWNSPADWNEGSAMSIHPIYPARVRVQRTTRSPTISLTVTWEHDGFTAGNEISIHFDMKNVDDVELTDCWITSNPYISGVGSDYKTTIAVGQTVRQTGTQPIVQSMVNNGSWGLSGISAFGTRNTSGGATLRTALQSITVN